jgi:hypothetical protein
MSVFWAGISIGHSKQKIIYCSVYATNKTGSSSDDWIYYQVATHSLLITLTHSLHSFISRSDTLQSTVAHATICTCVLFRTVSEIELLHCTFPKLVDKKEILRT